MTIDATSKRLSLSLSVRTVPRWRCLGLPPLTSKPVLISVLTVVAIPLVITFVGSVAHQMNGAGAQSNAPAASGQAKTEPAVPPINWAYNSGVDTLPEELTDALAASNFDSHLPQATTWASSSTRSTNTVSSHQGDTQEEAFLQFNISTQGAKKEYSASILTGIPVDCDAQHPAIVLIDGVRISTWKCSSFPVVVFDDGAAVLRDIQNASRIDVELPRQNPERRIHFQFAVSGLKPESTW